MDYHQYVNNKINYFKFKNGIYLTKNDFTFNKNIDYKTKFKKYENKIVELLGGFRIGTKDDMVYLPADVSKYEILLNFSSTDEKLKLLETFVITNNLFNEYLNGPYFTPQELAIIRRNCDAFARNGTLRLLKFARENNPPCPWSESTCEYAAEEGHLNILEWVRSQDPPCPWNVNTCAKAAEGGHLNILQWLRSQDPPCPWSSLTCAKAAGGGHLNILQWVRSQDPPCPWDEQTCTYAVARGHLNIVEWLNGNGLQCQVNP